jgi:DNA anti-recombination protein RmuC
MTTRAPLSPALLFVLTLLCVSASAQTPERRQPSPTPPTQEPPPASAPNGATPDTVANELGLLRKSLQTLNTRLRDISERLLAPDARQGEMSNDSRARIALNLDLLTRAEQRAEIMRRQLIELIEKETAYRSRLMQLDEEMRPDSIERSLSLVGTTRAPELRDVRRRSLENERRGVESLVGQTAMSRQRLEEDVKQADALVARLRQRVLPLIDREIDKIGPD